MPGVNARASRASPFTTEAQRPQRGKPHPNSSYSRIHVFPYSRIVDSRFRSANREPRAVGFSRVFRAWSLPSAPKARQDSSLGPWPQDIGCDYEIELRRSVGNLDPVRALCVLCLFLGPQGPLECGTSSAAVVPVLWWWREAEKPKALGELPYSIVPLRGLGSERACSIHSESGILA
jgi:hypothetical protein